MQSFTAFPKAFNWTRPICIFFFPEKIRCKTCPENIELSHSACVNKVAGTLAKIFSETELHKNRLHQLYFKIEVALNVKIKNV